MIPSISTKAPEYIITKHKKHNYLHINIPSTTEKHKTKKKI